ncbi:MAG TPA: type II secretion system F family protein [Streptosporangiaceae bacterium]|nr:type II secretion system F family protein [Streptosporangiaceae bacterium]
MTGAVLAGAVSGAGLFLFVLALVPRRASLARQMATFDGPHPLPRQAGTGERASPVSRRLGRLLAAFCAEQGWEFPSLRANLAIAGRSFESFLATKLLLALFGLVLGPAVLLLASLAGLPVPVLVPVWLGLALGGAFFFLPDLEARQQAAARRRDFRHAVGAFLDLVSINLSGGRGLPEALLAASQIGSGWAFWRLRDALASARITGQAPWQALGELGEEVRVDELRDLAAALSLVAEDGAKVRESLTARAASLRRRELADLEGQAGEKSQSMLVAQMLLCAGFLIFLTYPVVGVLLGT